MQRKREASAEEKKFRKGTGESCGRDRDLSAEVVSQ